MRKITFYALLVINFIIYFSFYYQIFHPIVQFTFSSILLSSLFLLSIHSLRKINFNKNQLIIILSIGLVYRIVLMPIGPIASDDVYRYLWDGKVQANGINPYKYSPSDEALKFLHSDILPSKINFPHMKTIYPPYSQWMFLLAYLISGEALWGIKILLLISELVTIVLIFLTLKNFRIEEKYTLVYALSPLPILQFFIDAHVDGFGITLLALFFYLLSVNKILYSYFTLGISITAKLISVLVYPFLLKGRSIKYFLSVVVVPIVTIALIYLPYSMSGFPFESLFIFAQKWYSNGAVFTFLQIILSDNFLARIFSMVLFFISYVWLYFSKKDFLDKTFLIFILFFIFSPVVNPWYITWIALLSSIHFRWSGIIFISTISISNIYAMNFILNKRWEMNEWLLVAEYLPVIILLFAEEFGKKNFIKFNHE